MASRVYVTQVPSFRSRGGWRPKHDLSPAESYGELKILMQPGNVPTTDRALRAARSGMTSQLQHFNAEGDYLLLLGDPVLVAMATMILTALGTTKLTLLKWDWHQERYLPVVIDF